MNRLILTALLILILLFGADRLLQHREHARYTRASTLRFLPDIRKAEAISSLRIELGARSWTYRCQGEAWHYPADHNAFVLGSRMVRFLEGCLENRGTVVADDPDLASHYGFSAKTTLKVVLKDSADTWQQTLWIGRSLPGRDTGEAFMRVAGSDTLFQVHADPRKILSPGPDRPPLLDPKVLPEALQRRAYVHLDFQAPGYPLKELRRVELAPADSTRRLLEGPRFEWIATSVKGSDPTSNAGVYAYLRFLTRLKYEALHDPQAPYNFDRYIVLQDEDGIRDTLETGGQISGGPTYLHHRTSGHIFSIAPEKTALLFPSPALLDSLPEESPYLKAEP